MAQWTMLVKTPLVASLLVFNVEAMVSPTGKLQLLPRSPTAGLLGVGGQNIGSKYSA